LQALKALDAGWAWTRWSLPPAWPAIPWAGRC